MNKSMCRTCLADLSNKKSNSLYTLINIVENDSTFELCKMLYDCTSVNCFANDELPSLVCQNCFTEIQRSFMFRLKCLESQTVLRSTTLNETIKENDFNFVKIEDIYEDYKYDNLNESNEFNEDVLAVEIKADDTSHVTDNLLRSPEAEMSEEYETEFKPEPSIKKTDSEPKLDPKSPYLCDICNKQYIKYGSFRVSIK